MTFPISRDSISVQFVDLPRKLGPTPSTPRSSSCCSWCPCSTVTSARCCWWWMAFKWPPWPTSWPPCCFRCSGHKWGVHHYRWGPTYRWGLASQTKAPEKGDLLIWPFLGVGKWPASLGDDRRQWGPGYWGSLLPVRGISINQPV